MSDKLLTILNNNFNNWISGEDISRQLGMTRAAIWKKISLLREEGYVIDAVPNKGYYLKEKPDLLTSNEILYGLTTAYIGKTIYYYKELTSTNNQAKIIASKEAPEGTLIISESQTGGRGRKGRAWHSAPGKGIYLSIILRPMLQPHEVSQITLMTAVAVIETFKEQYNLPFVIKWPNDILLQNKKISGILTEMECTQDAINYVIVGVGINVNIQQKNIPDEIKNIASSLYIETGEKQSRLAILQQLLAKFEYYYELFKKKQMPAIIAKWKTQSNIIGKKVEIDKLGTNIRGTVVDLTAEGFLVVEDSHGYLHEIISGDVRFDPK